MFLFLILFGVFVYAMTRTENTERTDLAYSPEAEPQDSDALLDVSLDRRPVGFEYKKISGADSLEREKQGQDTDLILI